MLNKFLNALKSESKIEKIAGFNIFEPTGENIEKFIKKYIMEELQDIPFTTKVIVSLTPQELHEENSDFIKTAYGSVTIAVNQLKADIPFIIAESELVPFDVIQVADQTIPYNRENIRKVLIGLKKMSEAQEVAQSEEAYGELVDKTNSSTDAGFLRDVIKIRDSQGGSGGKGGNYVPNSGNYTTASEYIEDVIEKISSIKELDTSIISNLENLAIERFVKTAEEGENLDITSEVGVMSQILADIKEMPFKNVRQMSNGQMIRFPVKDGSEITMESGIVMKNLKLLNDSTARGNVLIITENGDYIVLNSNEDMYAIEYNGDWKLKTTPILSVKEDCVYTSIVGDEVIYPFAIRGFDENDFDYEDTSYNDSLKKISLFKIHCKHYPNEGDGFTLFEVPGLNFEKVKSDDIRKVVEKHLSPKEANLIMSTVPYKTVACNKGTNVIKLNKHITGYLRNPKELEFKNTGDIFKTSSVTNDLKLEAVDKERGIYTLSVNFKSQGGKLNLPKLTKKQFENISEGKVKGILYAAKLQPSDIAELIAKANADRVGRMDIPEYADLERIQGGDVLSASDKAMKALKKGVFSVNRNFLEDLGVNILGEQVGDLASSNDSIEKAINVAGEILGNKSKYASEYLRKIEKHSKEVCVEFEKIAIEKESKNFKNLSSLMYATNKIASLLLEDKEYVLVKEAAEAVLDGENYLKDSINGLITLKSLQYKEGNEHVSPHLIKKAVDCIDGLYKISKNLKKGLLINGKTDSIKIFGK